MQPKVRVAPRTCLGLNQGLQALCRRPAQLASHLRGPASSCGPVDISAPMGGPRVQWHALSFGKQARSWMTRGRGGCWGWLHASSVTAGVGASLCSYSVTSAKAAVNGVHLHYLRTGDGEHAVLLLPGMLGVQVSLAARPAVLCSAPSPGCLGSMRSLSALLRCCL